MLSAAAQEGMHIPCDRRASVNSLPTSCNNNASFDCGQPQWRTNSHYFKWSCYFMLFFGIVNMGYTRISSALPNHPRSWQKVGRDCGFCIATMVASKHCWNCPSQRRRSASRNFRRATSRENLKKKSKSKRASTLHHGHACGNWKGLQVGFTLRATLRSKCTWLF